MKRLSLLSFALVLPVAAMACGSDDDGPSGGEEPTGEHSRYVVSTVSARSDNSLDIDGNGSLDNKLGSLVSLLTAGGFEVQETIDAAVVTGQALLLVDVQTESFTNHANAGVSFYLGDTASAMPTPCTDDTMLSTCGKHLAGTGSFTIAAGSKRDTELRGAFTGSKLKAGPGSLAIQIALTGAPIVVNLIGARAEISSVTADGIGKGVVGGALTETELNTNVFPAVQAQLKAVVDRDCGPENERFLMGGTTCGRMSGGTFTACVSTGAGVLAAAAQFDTGSPRDCIVSLAEIKANPIISSGTKSDVMVDGQPGVSVVLGFTAKKGTFTP